MVSILGGKKPWSRVRKQKNVDFALCWLREVDVLGFFEVRWASADATSARFEISKTRLRDD